MTEIAVILIPVMLMFIRIERRLTKLEMLINGKKK